MKNPLLTVDPEKCILCYACIRECPMKAIEAPANQQYINIVEERCTGCGGCYKVCPTRAIDFRSDMDMLKEMMERGEELTAITDPAIAAEFPDISDYRSFVGEIRSLGFRHVNDASFGADLVAKENIKILKDFKGRYLINSKCPAVNQYITKLHPFLSDNLVPLVTPLHATAALCRELFPGSRLVFITPCLSIRAEDPDLDARFKPDLVITFAELRQLFGEKNLNENVVDYDDFDKPHGLKGGLFPLQDGFMQSIGELEDLLRTNFISTCGHRNMIDIIGEFSEGRAIKKHIDVFYCEGCILGPGMSNQQGRYRKRTLVTDYVTKRIKKLDQVRWEEEMQKYSGLSLKREFKPDDCRLQAPDEKVVDEILRSIGKLDPKDNDRGCNACGYSGCREFAVAVAQGLARVEMCNSFSSKNRQEYINSLQLTNQKLAKTKTALEESERKAREEKEVVKALYGTITAVMHRIPSSVLIVDNELKVVEANQVLIDLLGDDARAIHEVIPGLKGADVRTLLPQNIHQYFSFVASSNEEILNKDVKLGNQILNISVFPVHRGRIIAAIIRDMSSPLVQKDETVKRIVEAIDKNLEMVQKIGFLLGEGAAETERMLNSIIQSLESGKKL
jgi:iron only hydrogenase large subunit-like protein